jgi:hypothetical protein
MSHPERSAEVAVRRLEHHDTVGDWVCLAGFVAVAVAVTMVPFVLL